MKQRSQMLKAVTDNGRITDGSGINGFACVLYYDQSGIYPADRVELYCVVSWGMGWEHVSVHARRLLNGKYSTPTWDMMCHAKDAFWNENEWVIQYHPAGTAYVNVHPHTLHLWKPVGLEFPKPPKVCV